MLERELVGSINNTETMRSVNLAIRPFIGTITEREPI